MALQQRDLGLGAQRVTEFFKSATRNMQFTVWTVRLIAAVMLIVLVWAINAILLPGTATFEHLQTLVTFVILFFYVIILALLTLVSYVSILASSISGVDLTGDYILAFRAFVVEVFFGKITLLPGFNSEDFFGANVDPFAPLAYLLNKPQKVVYKPLIEQGMIVLGILIIIITGIGFVRRSDVKLAGITLVVSQLTIGYAYVKNYTTDISLDNSSISTMLGSSLFQLALISYLYFEFSLQTGYLYDLTSPTLTRQRRVGKQLEKLSEFRLGITKLGTEEEKASAEAKKARQAEEDDDEVEEKSSVALAAGSSSTSAKKYNADALLFLLDSAQDSLFAKPGGEQERLTGRLQRYHDGLLQHDSKLDDKLGGSGEKTFNPLIVLATVIGALLMRLIILVFLSWLVLKPKVLLEFIALPESITNSLEIHQPEGLLMILVPVVFLILGISYLFARFQDWIVKAEELIIEEADIGRLIRAGRAITSREEGEQALATELEIEQKNQVSDSPSTPRKRKRRRKSQKK